MTRSERLRVERVSTRRRNRFWLGVFGLFTTTLVAGLAAWTVAPTILGWFPFAVTSGSMEPVIERGDVIVVQPHDGANLAEGTILLFETPQGPTAHRIVEVVSPVEYRTQGDANREPDSATVVADQVVGVARIAVPLIGRLVLFAREDPILHGIPLALGLLLAAWVSRFALMARYDPWARITAEDLGPAPAHAPLDIDRFIERRAAARDLRRRDPALARPAVVDRAWAIHERTPGRA